MKTIKTLILMMLCLASTLGKSQDTLVVSTDMGKYAIPLMNSGGSYSIMYCDSNSIIIDSIYGYGNGADTVSAGNLSFNNNSNADTLITAKVLEKHRHIYPYYGDYGLGYGYLTIISANKSFKSGYLHIDTLSNGDWKGIGKGAFGTTINLIQNVPTSEVCWVTVDTSSIHNLIVWDTTGTSKQGITSVRLYFYNASNQWQFISQEPYNDTSRYFVDTVNNPNANTVRYMLLAVNSCGNVEDTISSPWHNTMFINNSAGTFSWSGTGYLIEGVAQPVITYYLFRNDTIIDSVSGTQNKMTDVNYSTTATYYVAAKLNIDMCPLSPFAMGKKPESAAILMSHSNKVGKVISGIPNITNDNLFTAFPNPFSNSFNLYLPKEEDVRVYDELGQMIFYSRMAQGHNQVNIQGASGLYLLSVDGIFRKLVKE